MLTPYFENFYLNFIFSFIFLLTNFVCSININRFLNNRNIIAVGYFTIFVFIIATYAILLNLLLIFNLISISKTIFYFLFILTLLFSINSNSLEGLLFEILENSFIVLEGLMLIITPPKSNIRHLYFIKY